MRPMLPRLAVDYEKFLDRSEWDVKGENKTVEGERSLEWVCGGQIIYQQCASKYSTLYSSSLAMIIIDATMILVLVVVAVIVVVVSIIVVVVVVVVV